MKKTLFILGVAITILTGCVKTDVNINKKLEGAWNVTRLYSGGEEEVSSGGGDNMLAQSDLFEIEFISNENESTGILKFTSSHTVAGQSYGFVSEGSYEVQENGKTIHWVTEYAGEYDLSLELKEKNKKIILKGWNNYNGTLEEYHWFELEKI